MDAVVERLRTSKMLRSNAVERLGNKAGKEWAQGIAEYDELERIAKIDTSEWFIGVPMGHARSDLLAFEILDTPRDERESTFAEEFWDSALGDSRDPRLSSEKFLEGFIDGAAAVFRQVESEI